MAKTKMYKFREATNKWWDMVGLMDGTMGHGSGDERTCESAQGRTMTERIRPKCLSYLCFAEWS